ncbi:tyrosine recombinase XerC [Dactylosporangium sucinum]|uniref:Prophage phiRv2 integrase n=1 Tax=Dactylosporangium sucinum TaxID=1424081 RepID=A0A917X144_9ACTN|nr:site-specific integrase [Dactylosporangium sucinum]GGM50956.1 putative prophage phiRv2 integrase [Dactylosporangium sucinum]
MAAKRRHFGRVRKLPSGRYQARYPGPDGVLRPAPQTFERKKDAESWLSRKETDIARGDWLDPDAGKVRLGDYGAAWIRERPSLRPRTLVLYEGLLRLHIVPALGELALSEITTPRLRRWRRDLLDAALGPVTVAKAYRLLRAILNTAVTDRLIATNPCQIPGAGQEKSAERPVATLEQVFVIAANVPARYRALVLLACFNSLRWGELAGLARRHIDAKSGTIVVERAVVELTDGSLHFGPPKSTAGVRVVTVPAAILPEITHHLDEYAEKGPDGLLFVGPKGGPLRRSNFQDHWTKALTAAGVEKMHFHDLRHTGNTWAAETGATLRDLMDRMGHATTRAALIYLHKSAGRDQVIADRLSQMIEQSRAPKDDEDDDGQAGALVPVAS